MGNHSAAARFFVRAISRKRKGAVVPKLKFLQDLAGVALQNWQIISIRPPRGVLMQDRMFRYRCDGRNGP